MKTIEKLFAIGGTLALLSAIVQCGDTTTKPLSDMAIATLDMTMGPPDMTMAPPDMTTAPPDMTMFSAPSVTSVTPSSARNDDLTVLTVTGTNFRAGAMVHIGGVACNQVVVTSPTQLTCNFPGNTTACGGQNIVITNSDDNKSGTLAATMGLQLTSATFGYAAATDLPIDGSSTSVIVGDFNGDRKPDLVIAISNMNNVSVLLGNGLGGFSAVTSFTTGSNPDSIAVGDLNGDQKPDLVIANYGSSNVSVLLGNGRGGFSPATNFTTGAAPLFEKR